MRAITNRHKESRGLNKGKSSPVCKVTCFHAEDVVQAKTSIPSENQIVKLVDLYSSIASPTRLKIIFALEKGELCVCDIANTIDLSIPATSHQLKHLSNKSLLTYRNDGKMVYYSLRDRELIKILKGDVRFSKGLEKE